MAEFQFTTIGVIVTVIAIVWVCAAAYFYSKDGSTTKLSLLCQSLLGAIFVVGGVSMST